MIKASGFKVAAFGAAFGFSACISALRAAAPIVPIEDFARSPLYDDMQLSFDGQCLAFLTEYDGQRVLCFQEGKPDASGKWVGQGIIRVDPGRGKFNFGWKDIYSFNWISPKRVLFSTVVQEQFGYGTAACDRNGHYMMPVGGLEREQTEHPLYLENDLSNLDRKSGFILMEEQRVDPNTGYVSPCPDVARVDTVHGTADRIIENPGHVTSWYADESGVVRAGLIQDPESLDLSVIYRKTEADRWQTIKVPDANENNFVPIGFGQNSDELLVSHREDSGRWVTTTFDVIKGVYGSSAISDDQYDVGSPHSDVYFDHTPLSRHYYNPQTHALEGVAYVAEGPRVKWLTEATAQRQAMIDQALPKRTNFIRNTSQDGQRLLILSFSDRDPGIYYLYDAKANSLSVVGGRMPWIKPETMAPMFPIKVKARDGLQLHGYVTLPLDVPRQHLPMVVLVHGGPASRDTWEFDSLVQLLANRGYAVLQINFRGSVGYGDPFLQKSLHEIGGTMQTDIDDATQWAIKSGLADPKRIAIVGASYGGYATLYGLETRPDLYRCGISFAGVTDWGRLISLRSHDQEARWAYNYWVKQIGDPKADAARLAAVSPVTHAADLKSPLLIMQGEEDLVVPPAQAHEMIDAMKKAGNTPETVFISGLPHSFGNEHQRVAIYKRFLAFLDKNMK